jgi:hypothetical protein
MKKQRILNNSLNVIKKYLKENGPIMNTTTGPTNSVGVEPEKISGLLKDPPIKLKKKRAPFKDLFRRGQSVQPKYTR